jgi:putative membrane protein
LEDPRVYFAAERTLLAWIRTGLALMGFGFVVARFGLFLHELAAAHDSSELPRTGLSLWIGTALVILGVSVTIAASVQHRRIIDDLKRGAGYDPPRWSLGIMVAALLSASGIAMVGYLLWVGR